jgi:hypothetical protein
VERDGQTKNFLNQIKILELNLNKILKRNVKIKLNNKIIIFGKALDFEIIIQVSIPRSNF